MLFIAKKEDERFYVNSEDVKKYADKGFEIIDENTGQCLNAEQIAELKPAVVEVPVFGHDMQRL